MLDVKPEETFWMDSKMFILCPQFLSTFEIIFTSTIQSKKHCILVYVWINLGHICHFTSNNPKMHNAMKVCDCFPSNWYPCIINPLWWSVGCFSRPQSQPWHQAQLSKMSRDNYRHMAIIGLKLINTGWFLTIFIRNWLVTALFWDFWESLRH